MTANPLSTPTYTPAILSILPLFYVAWSDNILSPSELALMKKTIATLPALSKEEKALLDEWCNPKTPPTQELMGYWIKLLRKHSKDINVNEKTALTSLGFEMAKKSSGQAESILWNDAATRLSIQQLEAALGTIKASTYRSIFRQTPIEDSKPSAFDHFSMRKFLDGEYHDQMEKTRRLLQDPIFELEYQEGKKQFRDRTMEWCKHLAKQGLGIISYPKAVGGEADMHGYVGNFTALGFHDLSLVIKFGVQFGLWGMSVEQLGTEKHHRKYLNATGNLELAGCFAMTETGHGSNVRSLQTTATYDPKTDEIIINTPTQNDGKEYIGNALHGSIASVFAQLIVNGESKGVHAIVVPLRDANNDHLPGIVVKDCGYKVGLNGVDNGRIWFDQVRVPRENLLNRFGDIDDQGNYSSPIENPGRRFFTMLGTLVGGRVCVPRAGLSAAKTGLTIAINYALTRRQFAPKAGDQESLLLDYPSHQQRLMPLLAKAYALNFSLDYLAKRFMNREEKDIRYVETLAAGLKSYATWFTTETLQECREACGGKGYLWENRFAELKADSDIFTTFEGDNTVLMQLVAKGILSEFKQEFHDDGFRAVLRMLGGKVATNITERNFIATRNTDEEHLLDPEFHIAAFTYREKELLYSVSNRMRSYIKNRMDPYDAFLNCQGHMLKLANAYVERKVLTSFVKAIPEAPEKLQPSLRLLCNLYALDTLQKNKGWFLEKDYFQPVKTKAIRKLVEQLCSDVRDQAGELVEAFGVPERSLGKIGVKGYTFS